MPQTGGARSTAFGAARPVHGRAADIEDGRFSNPTLTTISPDKEHIGRLAVRALVARVEGKPADTPREVQPPFRLVTRESTLGRR